jgi:hypothetical protein
MLANDVVAVDELLREVVEIEDDSADRTKGRAQLSKHAQEAFRQAVEDLCRGGLLKRGQRVSLEPTTVEFLSETPLVDGAWLDRAVVEFAEIAAEFNERGLDLLRSFDLHPLASL